MTATSTTYDALCLATDAYDSVVCEAKANNKALLIVLTGLRDVYAHLGNASLATPSIIKAMDLIEKTLADASPALDEAKASKARHVGTRDRVRDFLAEQRAGAK